jgi:hypothetical protein
MNDDDDNSYGDDSDDDGMMMVIVVMVMMMRIRKYCSLYNVMIAAILHDLHFPAHIISIGLNHNIMQMLNLAGK